MSDIVDRLRREAGEWRVATHTVTGPKLAELLYEAADEIDRLRRTAGETGQSFRDIKDEINGAPV